MEKTRRNRISLVIGLGMLVAVIVAGYFPKGYFLSGFGGTHKHKTLWDWLNLAGVVAVPLVLAWFGFRLQLQQQKQNDLQKKRELEQTKAQFEEEALQHYLDRVSNLVLEKNLLAISAKLPPTTEERELLEASVAVIRLLTLSILRRLSDGVRKASVVRILIDTDIILGLKVSLRDADLSDADLRGADLFSANLRGAILTSAILNDADLSDADLNGADLSGAYLSGADLSGASLNGADLSGASLRDARKLTKEQLEKAYLCGTKLPEGIDMDPNRDCSKDYYEWLSEGRQLPPW